MPKRIDLESGAGLSLYIIAGIATSPDYMEGLRHELVQRFREQTGSERIRSMLLHPYGSWDRSFWGQLRDIRRDLRLRIGSRTRSLGGQQVFAQLNADNAAQQGPLWLVGHSGGGVAAVHAAELLLASGFAADCRIVQVGSPRCAVPESLRERTAYLYAAGPGGSLKDQICRFGSWGGWVHDEAAGHDSNRQVRRQWTGWPWRLSLLRWSRDKHAPIKRVPMPIIGGHADYFRTGDMFTLGGGGCSNLELTVAAMWPTLMEGFAELFVDS